MLDNSSLTEKLATLGFQLPGWPEEPEEDCASGAWILRGQAYAEGMRLWRVQLRNAPESTKAVVDQLLRHLQDIAQLGVWDQLVYRAIKPEVQGSPDYERWQACTKLIRSSEITPAQLLGISLCQAELGNFETVRLGVSRLSEAGLLDETLRKDLCLKVLIQAVEKLPKSEEIYDKEMASLIDKHISIIKLINEWLEQTSLTNTNDSDNLLKKILSNTSNPVILIAGMRHSASTALFNAVRIGAAMSGRQVSSGYSEYFDIKSIKRKTGVVSLIKIHEYREDYCQQADFVITTRRDLRDSVASAKRRGFKLLNKMGSSIQYAAYNRSLHRAWNDISDYELSYDHFISNPAEPIKDIFELIGINSEFAIPVAEAIKIIPTDNYSVTLLSETHITDPKQELTFRDTLEASEITSIYERNRDWLKRYSYI